METLRSYSYTVKNHKKNIIFETILLYNKYVFFGVILWQYKYRNQYIDIVLWFSLGNHTLSILVYCLVILMHYEFSFILLYFKPSDQLLLTEGKNNYLSCMFLNFKLEITHIKSFL